MTLPVITSPLLDVAGVRHAFFTRQGGVSQGIYESLNVGIGSKDDPDAVIGRQLTRLIGADEMGELFKVCAIHTPDWTPPAFEPDP